MNREIMWREDMEELVEELVQSSQVTLKETFYALMEVLQEKNVLNADDVRTIIVRATIPD